jgi:hypothetical protein
MRDTQDSGRFICYWKLVSISKEYVIVMSDATPLDEASCFYRMRHLLHILVAEAMII